MFTSVKLLFLSGKIEPTTVRVTNNIRIFKVYSAVTGVTSLVTAMDVVRLVYYDLGGEGGIPGRSWTSHFLYKSLSK